MAYLSVSATLIWFIYKDGVSHWTSNLTSNNYPIFWVHSKWIKTNEKNYLIDGLIKYNHVLFKAGLTGEPVTLDVVPDYNNVIIKKPEVHIGKS